LVLRQKDVQVKVATGEKVLKKDWDAKNQLVKETEYTYKSINKFLLFLKQEVEKHFETAPHSQFTDKKVKENFVICK
jgi:DNA (cytosine-5)-methyltransferase 1